MQHQQCGNIYAHGGNRPIVDAVAADEIHKNNTCRQKDKRFDLFGHHGIDNHRDGQKEQQICK